MTLQRGPILDVVLVVLKRDIDAGGVRGAEWRRLDLRRKKMEQHATGRRRLLWGITLL